MWECEWRQASGLTAEELFDKQKPFVLLFLRYGKQNFSNEKTIAVKMLALPALQAFRKHHNEKILKRAPKLNSLHSRFAIRRLRDLFKVSGKKRRKVLNLFLEFALLPLVDWLRNDVRSLPFN